MELLCITKVILLMTAFLSSEGSPSGVTLVRQESLCPSNGAATCTGSPSGVTLVSTLRQGSLCPGHGAATFTCTTIGTDLTWIVGGRLMSYNANARVGAIRSDASSDETSILMRVDSLGENGRASRMSVLTIIERVSATQPLTVECHNGSENQIQRVTFWRKTADTPGMPVILNSTTINDRVNITWQIRNVNTEIQTIDHYILQVDENFPTLIKNTSAVFFVEDSYTIRLRAIDKCDQEGEVLSVHIPFIDLSPAQELIHTTVHHSIQSSTDSVSILLETSGTKGRSIAVMNILFLLSTLYILSQ